MTPGEFSRPLRIDTIGELDHDIAISADAEERVALADRFDLIAIGKLEARFAVRRDATGIIARGHVSAALTQACSVTGDPLPVVVEEDAVIRFFEEGTFADEETELNEADCDSMFYSGGAIDLGEASAETMVLALDPYPRGPAAAAALKAAGIVSEEDAKPLGALAGLKAKLEGR